MFGSALVLEVKVDVLTIDIFEDGLEESMTTLFLSMVVSVNCRAEDGDLRTADDDSTKVALGSELVFDVNVEDFTETADSLAESKTSEYGAAVGDT